MTNTAMKSTRFAYAEADELAERYAARQSTDDARVPPSGQSLADDEFRVASRKFSRRQPGYPNSGTRSEESYPHRRAHRARSSSERSAISRRHLPYAAANAAYRAPLPSQPRHFPRKLRPLRDPPGRVARLRRARSGATFVAPEKKASGASPREIFSRPYATRAEPGSSHRRRVFPCPTGLRLSFGSLPPPRGLPPCRSRLHVYQGRKSHLRLAFFDVGDLPMRATDSRKLRRQVATMRLSRSSIPT